MEMPLQCNSGSNRSPYRIQCNSSSNKPPYRIEYNSSSNRSPYRIQCNSIALTGLPIGYIVIHSVLFCRIGIRIICC